MSPNKLGRLEGNGLLLSSYETSNNCQLQILYLLNLFHINEGNEKPFQNKNNQGDLSTAAIHQRHWWKSSDGSKSDQMGTSILGEVMKDIKDGRYTGKYEII